MKMIESGLVDHWMEQYWPAINRCSADSLSKAGEPMTLEDTQSAFFLVFLGLGLAALSLFFEIIASRWIKAHKQGQFKLKGSRTKQQESIKIEHISAGSARKIAHQSYNVST